MFPKKGRGEIPQREKGLYLGTTAYRIHQTLGSSSIERNISMPERDGLGVPLAINVPGDSYTFEKSKTAVPRESSRKKRGRDRSESKCKGSGGGSRP